jgi:hypothetical protein
MPISAPTIAVSMDELGAAFSIENSVGTHANNLQLPLIHQLVSDHSRSQRRAREATRRSSWKDWLKLHGLREKWRRRLEVFSHWSTLVAAEQKFRVLLFVLQNCG